MFFIKLWYRTVGLESFSIEQKKLDNLTVCLDQAKPSITVAGRIGSGVSGSVVAVAASIFTNAWMVFKSLPDWFCHFRIHVWAFTASTDSVSESAQKIPAATPAKSFMKTLNSVQDSMISPLPLSQDTTLKLAEA